MLSLDKRARANTVRCGLFTLVFHGLAATLVSKNAFQSHKVRRTSTSQPHVYLESRVADTTTETTTKANDTRGDVTPARSWLPQCPLCRKDHSILDCHQFFSSSLAQRCKIVMRCKLCALCLKSGHIARECKHPKKCTAQNCDRPHHPLLNDKEMACVLYTEIHGEYPPEESQDVQGREDPDYSKEEKREVISTPLYRGTLNVPCAGVGTAKHRPFRPSLYRRIFYQEGYKREGTADTSKSNANAWFSLEDSFSGASGSPGVPDGLFLGARAWTLHHNHL